MKYLPGLADSMAPVLGLLIIVGIEIEVVEDDGVGSSEVNSQAASFGREDKHEIVIVIVVGVDECLSGKRKQMYKGPSMG